MMKHRRLREEVCEANMELHRRGLVICSWGNVSGIDREAGVVVIKPSGVAYADLTPGDLVAVSLANSVKLIDQQSGKQYATLMLPDHFTPRSLAFSPEGHQLAVASTGKEIQVWQLDRIRKKLTPLGLDWKLPPYAKQDDQVPKPIRAEIDNGR